MFAYRAKLIIFKNSLRKKKEELIAFFFFFSLKFKSGNRVSQL